MTGLLLAVVVVPLLGLALGRRLLGTRAPRPSLGAAALLGFFLPPAVVTWFGRSPVEIAAAMVVSGIAVAGLAVAHDPPVMVAFGLVGAAWGFYLALMEGSSAAATSPKTTGSAPAGPSARRADDTPGSRGPARRHEEEEAMAFAIELRCPGCGAILAVPVYHRMVRCEYCGSEHVVAAPSEPVVAIIPDRIDSEEKLRDALVDHFRYQRYVALYQQRVAPLLRHQRATEERRPEQLILTEGKPNPLVELAERRVSRAADTYAEQVRKRLRITGWRRVASPYWHRFGTLYQTAFGRDQAGQKRVEMTVRTFETSLPASSAPLPEMGKLSYLRALRPLAAGDAVTLPALPVDQDLDALEQRVEQLSQRSIDLPIRIIGRRSVFVPEVTARIYRPWHIAGGDVAGKPFSLLVDGGGARVAETAPPDLPETTGGLELDPPPPPSLTPSRCPDCGGDFPFCADAVAELCHNCYRMLEMSGGRWRTRTYLWEDPRPAHWLLPFWRFPFRLRTGSGEVIRTVAHFTDGIDGTLDQIGVVPPGEDVFYVPAFRTRVGAKGVRLYRRLWPLVQGYPHQLHRERFSPAHPPGPAMDITLPEDEARVFSTVYLALAFTPRDLARAEIRRMREQFLEAEMDAGAELTYLAIPEAVVEPNRALFGRTRPQVITGLEGR